MWSYNFESLFIVGGQIMHLLNQYRKNEYMITCKKTASNLTILSFGNKTSKIL